MNFEQMLKSARGKYAQPTDRSAPKLFPEPPSGALSLDEFLDRLIETACEHNPKLRHPFAIRLVQGYWNKKQVQEWVRQDYQRTIQTIRRHALLAANSADYEVVWGLLTRVKAEADSDPVGGTFFALPQLWLKFGIALGLTREEIVGCRPHPLLGLINDSMLSEVRFASAFSVREFVDAVLDPIFYQLWGEALGKSLGLPRDAMDFFWAIGADRWGEETGRSILQSWAGSRENQVELWNKYRAEVADDREWHRLTILQTILESTKAESDCRETLKS